MTNQVQCPNCSNYKVFSTEFRVNPKTGKRIPHAACLTEFYKLIAIPIGVIAIIILVVLGFILEPMILLGAVAIGVAMAWRIWQESEYKQNPAGYDHTCESCGKEWTVNPKI